MPKILVLGAGFVAEPLVEYLHRSEQNTIMVASHLIEEAKQLAEKFERVEPVEVDVTNYDALMSALSEMALVVSLVPAPFHPLIAKAAIAKKIPMVTASYVSDEMRALDSDAKKAGITILNEIGLDPGIDHLTAMQIIDQAHEQNKNIESFVSWCGGLPSPESNNNPLGYKFSWAPKGVLMALLNEAQYLKGQVNITVSSDQLMDWTKPLDISGLKLEGYPNRESSSYREVYGIEECHDLLRGTLRYRGFSEIIKAAHKLSLLNTETDGLDKSSLNWVSYLEQLNKQTLDEMKGSMSEMAFDALAWLGCFSDKKIADKAAPIDVFCDLLIEKLQYENNETDMVVLQHKFVIADRSNSEVKEYLTSTLKVIGDAKGYSAMSKTVGYPAAIASQLILDGTIKDVGVLVPVQKSIYQPILELLEKENVVFDEVCLDSNETSKAMFLSELQ